MSFVGIKDGVTLKGGEPVRRDQLEDADPERFGKVINVVHPQGDVSTIVDRPVARGCGGQLFRHTDHRPRAGAGAERPLRCDRRRRQPGARLINPEMVTFVVPAVRATQ